ncbi:MAG TPA: hypothetical protein VII23_06345 [Terriglobales bacterium]
MTTALNCRLSATNPALTQLKNISSLQPFIQAHYLNGSHGDISLTLSGLSLVPGEPVTGTITALQLHNFMLAVNRNVANAPVRNICVLFADSYDPLPSAFGMMFDRGFVTDDDPNGASLYLAQPRQACAVFLNTIQSARSADQFVPEAMFTTVHEMGHIFNLQHDETCLNFMRVSESQGAYDQSAYRFTPDQQSRLETCSSDSTVMPGGSPFGIDNASNLDAANRLAQAPPIALEIAIARREFWRFEPTQLEIEIAPAEGTTEVSVPALIDPGHEQFRVMIENNLDERSLYRSPTHTCGPVKMVTVTCSKPYRRDLPIFGESGGYTFRRAGRHRIWVEFNLGETLVKSNVVEVNVKREISLGRVETESREVLSSPAIASLLFHREDSADQIATRKLARYIEQTPGAPGAVEINYALGHAIRKHMKRNNGGSLAAPYRPEEFFERAVEFDDLGPHRTRRAEAILGEIAS